MKNNNTDYNIKDLALAPEGRRRIDWVKRNMPLLSAFERKYGNLPENEKPFAGVRVALSIHMEPKTAYLCEVLTAAGATVSATGCNPLSTQDSAAAALAAEGISVYAIHGSSEEDYYTNVERCLEIKPNIVIDDGGDLVHMLHTTRPDLARDVIGGCEETTTGVIRLKAMEREGSLKFPMLAVNDARCKHLFDNRYGTGQSVWDSIMRNTNLIIASKTVVVAGYGWCGRGIALRASALGASVIVTEIDPVKAMEAKMDGHGVMTMSDATSRGDIFITATGTENVITHEHIALMKDGAILGNAGHFNVEINMAALESAAVRSYEARQNVTAYEFADGRIVNVIAEGRLLNIAAADGHPAEIMDLSFAVQFLSAAYILEHKNELPVGVINVAEEIDEAIARMRLEAWGVTIDALTREQVEYLNAGIEKVI
jgi:adenosylhomocysteinase